MSEISKTADKAISILFQLARLDAATPQQLSLTTGVNRTVSQRLLSTLLAWDFVVRAGREYTRSYRLRELAQLVQPRLRRAVEPQAHMLSEQTGETVVFQIPDGGDLVVLVEATQPQEVSLHVRHEVGSGSPITQSASGLAILGALSATEVVAFLRQEPSPELAARLNGVRADGYARTSNELQQGVSGLATAVRDGDEVVGSLAILVPTSRSTELDGYRRDMDRTVARIERALS